MSSSVLRCKSSRRMFSHVGCFTMSLCLVPVETVLAKPQLDELVVVEHEFALAFAAGLAAGGTDEGAPGERTRSARPESMAG